MLNNIIIFCFSLLGLIFVLLTFILKMIVWRIDHITVTIPLYYEDKDIFKKIYFIRSLFEFCAIEKKCTVAIINYNAPEIICDEIRSFYKNYTFVKLISPDELKNLLIQKQ